MTDAAATGTILEIRDLRIDGDDGVRWAPIIAGVDLSVARGEVVGLIGESGSGKTTIGLAALGYTRPGCRISGGAIRFAGMDMIHLPEEKRRYVCGTRIAYVAQSAAANFNPVHRLIDQTVESVVRRGVKSRRDAEAEARELYRELILPDPDRIGRRYPHQVSGGQLQRVMTAMALIARPDLIVFDEPTTALDVTTQVDVLLAIRKVVERYGVAAIFITHDLAVVSQMADRIIVLKNGRKVEEAPTRTMIAEPENDYTKSLWAVRTLDKPEASRDGLQLSLAGVEVSYAGRKALHDVSFEVPRGRTLAIVGESGSGKSTTARAIVGLNVIDSGRIVFDGEPLPLTYRRRSKDQLRRIQYIYQMADTALNPRQTVGEVIARPLRFYGGLKGKALEARVGELLRMIELDPSFASRLPEQLSGGQKQRICIARALAAEPELIICDEVVSALDQVVQKEVLTLLMRLQTELGVTYIFITHDIAVVRAIADEVVVMHRGRVVEQGRKSEVLEPPYLDYTKLLLSSVPEMDPDWLAQIAVARGGPPRVARPTGPALSAGAMRQGGSP